MATALVTGASTGIGLELARLFAADGDDLVLVASERSQDRLTALAEELATTHGIQAQAITLDLAADGAADRLVAELEERGVVVDHLVNNAGFGIVGLRAQDYDRDECTRMVRLNVLTLTDLTTALLPGMVARGRGSVLNVSSVAAYVVPHGLEAGYAATKAYVRSFSEALAQDLRGTGVTCTHLAPGPTKTGFFSTAGVVDQTRIDSVSMDAAAVARAGYKALRRGRTAVVPGAGAKTMRVAAGLSPSRRATAAVSAFFVRRH